jgi:hypothetical protein
MDNLYKEVTPLLTFLLPGFLSAWMFYGLTSHPKPGQFERTIEALVFTFVVQGLIELIQLLLEVVGRTFAIGAWTATSQVVWSVIVAILLGSTVAAAVNKDVFHTWLRRKGLTSRSSHPSEWFCVLASHSSDVILHLKDGRRLTGWPKEWPVDPCMGQFYLQDPAWILEDGPPLVLAALDGIIIRAEDVRWVELLPAKGGDDGISP